MTCSPAWFACLLLISALACDKTVGHDAQPCDAGACPSNQYCISGECVSAACQLGADGGTVLSDAGSSTCPASYSCLAGVTTSATPVCVIDSCTAASDCPATYACTSGHCLVPSCTSTSQCPSTYTCQSGTCAVDPNLCTDSSQCTSPARCADVGAGYKQCSATCLPATGCAPEKCDYDGTCVAPIGALGQGQACVRGETMDDDTCADQYYCTSIGTAPATGARVCQRFCSQDSDCPATERCGAFSAAEKSGICVPSTCSLFGASGCPSQTACTVTGEWATRAAAIPSFLPLCDTYGTTAAGASCTVSEECVAGTICINGVKNGVAVSACEPFCDASHLCATGTACQVQRGLPSGEGWCF